MIWITDSAIIIALTVLIVCGYHYKSNPWVKKTLIIVLLVMVSVVGLCWLWGFLFVVFMHGTIAHVRPWTIVTILHYSHALSMFDKFILWIIPSIPILTVIILIAFSLNERYGKRLYGNAHWASRFEARKYCTISQDHKKHSGNFIVGKLGNSMISAPLTNGVLLFAPARSGKGVGNVIPNALCYPDSLLVTDLKFEIFEATSGYRASQGHEVYLFAPTRRSRKTHCMNPLDYVNKDDVARKIADIQLIVETLIPFESKTDKMWTQEARSIAQGLLLWLFDTDRPHTIGELSTIIKAQADLSAFLKGVLDDAVIATNLISMDPTAYININNFLDKAPKEQSGVKSTLTAKLTLWDDPIINAATAKSDFDFRDMRKKRMTVYLGVQTNQIDRMAPLLNLFIQLFLNVMTDELPQDDEPFKVLAILDEFCNMGNMPILKRSFSYIPGYNVYLAPIIQNIGQFFEIYGGRDQCDIFFQNTDYKIAFGQNTKTDRDFVSEQLGDRTVKVKTKTRQSGGSVSYSESYIARPLISSAEVGRLSKKQAILIASGYEPLKYEKIVYYKDAYFTRKMSEPIDMDPIVPVALSFEVNPRQPEDDTKEKTQPSPNNKRKKTAKSTGASDENATQMQPVNPATLSRWADEFDNLVKGEHE